ncbi:protein ZNRD2 [Xyrauchen texanus]|uniref:protein ZNRD2 n=1 Tax=Xyrauchen texanus TaxID=154827 RepID=UPI002241DB2A|nr:protein ZNRD2 [Xyrauchen texanus]
MSHRRVSKRKRSLCCQTADEESMALNADDEDFEWEPPSEAEMKVIQARRERQDKISKLMGGYLLKGYKMLGECCELCGTILMQDKQKKNYCVACQELDSDIDKDNPALNAQAALSQVRERQLAAHPPPEANGASASDPPLAITGQPRPEHCEGAASGLRGPLPTIQPAPLPVPTASPIFLPPTNPPIQPANPSGSLGNTLQHHPALSSAEEAVLHKLRWATQELQHSVSVEASIQLCNLIRGCAESLRSLKELQLT